MNRRLVAWLALGAMALNALWPLLAHAAPRTFTASICSVNPAQSELARTDLPQPPTKLTAAHCPWCVSWSGFAAPVMALAWSFLLPVPEAAGFQASTSVPLGIGAVLDTAPPPRAPPLT